MRQKKGIDIDKADPKQAKRINAIARVSAELFSANGYLETSMDDIAAAAKVTKGGVYHYFGSKAEILYFICSTYVEFDVENLEQTLAGAEEPAEKVRIIVHRHIDHYTRHTAAAKTLLNEAYNLPPRPFKEVKAREKRYYKIVTGVLAQYLGEGARKDVVTALAFTLFGMLNWIYSWYDPKGALSPEELSRLIYEVFTRGAQSPFITGRDARASAGRGRRAPQGKDCS